MTVHGHTTKTTASATYRCWANMVQRCTNPNNPQFADYGGRGISFNPSWRDFGQFLADMGVQPPGQTLERLNNGLGYSKDNCAWASRRDQQRNRRNNHLLTLDGETLCMQDWADRLGVRRNTIHYRIYKYGWPLREALTTKRGERLTP